MVNCELFVLIGELLRGSDLPFLGLRVLDLFLWLQAVGQLSSHSAVLLTLQKFPSAYSVGVLIWSSIAMLHNSRCYCV